MLILDNQQHPSEAISIINWPWLLTS